MKRIYHLAITGGPCAGKTEGIKELKTYLSKKGFRVLLIQEIATSMMKNGIVPYDNCVTQLEFQKIIFEEQLFRENLMYKVAEELQHDLKIVVIEDRTLMDNKIYLEDNQFEEILEKFNLSEKEVLSRYDLVIHMVSASVQEDVNFYNRTSNEYRMENIEEAKRLELRGKDVWKNHPNIVRVNIMPTFEEKIEKIKEVVQKFLEF